ncbi:hypothetical protein PGT21_029743 [Puccinia graminis f. sp. tritici]|uniref:Uncharacterized protein n=1 Tax=Puccinia graminis f. sp. tritici TaxID=56615 RepID=A0A5B0NDR6_PUCGR|nr:hypothetical protein PGT21_029743 [Puccinia graminis f. sp. tritici]
MFDSLRLDSGAKHIQQSHKPLLTLRALERFHQMADVNRILDVQSKAGAIEPLGIPNTYIEGVRLLQEEVHGKPSELGRFKLHLPFDEQCATPPSDPEESPLLDSDQSPDIEEDEISSASTEGSMSGSSMDEDMTYN